MAERLTVLESFGPRLTKKYLADGGTETYEKALSFKVKAIEVANLPDVAALLGRIHKNPKRCIIRGKLGETPEPGEVKGSIRRSNASFEDQPLHTFMLDIDGFEPFAADPVKEPADAVRELFLDYLPACFMDASFYWHLSSSAGMPGKEGKLKCHVWMWSRTAYTSAQMKAWAREIGTVIDSAVYSRVQVNYTADPIFEEGRVDPVEVRSGWYQGANDEVDLQITEDILAAAHSAGAGAGGEDMKLKDPSQKEGIIGLFHRVFDADDVLLTHLDAFEQVSQRRYTWFGGGGTPEGVWVHNDGMHIASSHNTWPLPGIANLWDVVRVFKFGHLDEVEGDDFETLVAESRTVGQRASDKAMMAWAEELPEIKEAMIAEADAHFLEMKRQIDEAASVAVLETRVAPALREEAMTESERIRITEALRVRYKALSGVALPVGTARRWLAQRRDVEEVEIRADWVHEPPEMSEDAPDWAKEWVWVAELDSFMHKVRKNLESPTSYNARFNRFMSAYADGDGRIPEAARYSLREWRTQVFDKAEYHPGAKWCYVRDGLHCFNLYRPELLPVEPAKYSEEEKRAIRIVEDHFSLIFPDEKERTLLLDWAAYCVQYPGHKVRWAPLIIGQPGDGKTSIFMLLGAALGANNVKTVKSVTLESAFSGWATGSVLFCVEELKLHGHNRHDVINSMKDLITNDRVEVHPKGRDPYNTQNFMNVLLLSNHRDAAPIDDNDRRFFYLTTPFVDDSSTARFEQQVRERFGIASYSAYFDRLYDQALKNERMFGALRKWLRERPLSSGFEPNGRAPDTAAKLTGIELSISDVDEATITILREGGLGIYPNLVSTKHLMQALRNRNPELRLPQSRGVRVLLMRLGFVPYVARLVTWGREGLCTFYYRGTPPRDVASLADKYENERKAHDIENDFTD